jgi:phosphoribosylamine--glycine ligase
MNVLLLDQTSCFVDFALRCRNVGHNVRVCMGVIKETKLRSPIGDGLVEKIEREEWQKHIGWADLIVASDNVRWLRELDIQKKRGQPVFAPSYESAELELDRAKGQKFLADHGVKVIPYKTFSDYGAAEKYVRETMQRYVSKPNGDRDKALSYVSESPADMVYMLQRWKASQKNVTSPPCSRILPASGVSNPAIIRSVVVLPQPLGPSIEKNSPAWIEKVAPFTATVGRLPCCIEVDTVK